MLGPPSLGLGYALNEARVARTMPADLIGKAAKPSMPRGRG